MDSFAVHDTSSFDFKCIILRSSFYTFRFRERVFCCGGLGFVRVFIFVVFSNGAVSVVDLPSSSNLTEVPRPHELITSPVSLAV